MRKVVRSSDAGNSGSQPRSSAPTTMEILAMRTRSGGSPGEPQYPITRSADDLLAFSVMPADHRNYALTWFALAGATAFLAVRAGRVKGA
jgi:surfeit locus 1 family protein